MTEKSRYWLITDENDYHRQIKCKNGLNILNQPFQNDHPSIASSNEMKVLSDDPFFQDSSSGYQIISSEELEEFYAWGIYYPFGKKGIYIREAKLPENTPQLKVIECNQ